MRPFARDELASPGCPPCTDDGHARATGELHGRGANAAARTVDEHRLSGLSLRAGKESAMRGAIRNRDRGAFSKGNVLG